MNLTNPLFISVKKLFKNDEFIYLISLGFFGKGIMDL